MDLGFLRFVSAIGTQGAISQETQRIYYVKAYKVDVSSNGEDWITLKEGSKQKVPPNMFSLNSALQKLNLETVKRPMKNVSVFLKESSYQESFILRHHVIVRPFFHSHWLILFAYIKKICQWRLEFMTHFHGACFCRVNSNVKIFCN